ncbi:MAG: SDR family oxidoreductase [Polyangiaceae bacterium]|nr:SDR family oxidoreductase [Polyangiaceae bacterium]
MAKTIVICGHGSGISDAVARKFGKEGYSVAIVARRAERLTAAAAALTESGIKAKAFPCDLGNAEAVQTMIRGVRSALGPVSVVHWNAYGGGAGDLTTSKPDELRGALNVAVHGMIAAVQEALPDLKAQKGALLVTGGGLCMYDANVDAMAVSWGAMGLAVAKAAQHKTTGLLHQRLAKEGVYVGEVVVMGAVKGTAFDRGNATIEASGIADKFWDLYQARTEASVNFA